MNKSPRSIFPMVLAAAGLSLLAPGAARASDYGDAPSISQDSGADLADAYLFMDPNDNTKVVVAMTVHGFIVPAEANNFAAFDPRVKYVFKFENTGDAKPDLTATVTFSEKTAPDAPQRATVKFKNSAKPLVTFAAQTTPTTLAAEPYPPVTTKDPASQITFFAGEVDDPSFFDVVAFSRFVPTLVERAPQFTVFERGRDSFAGYNALAIVLSVPIDFLRGPAPAVGVTAITKRATQTPGPNGGFTVSPPYAQVDRVGNPAINAALIPYAKKDLYNASTPQEDAAGKFAPDIEATLQSFGTDATHIGILESLAVTTGDYLRVNLSIPNSGAGGGDVVFASFPNGRRPSDDVMDTILTTIVNGRPLSDNVDANDVPFRDAFPFFAPAHQPLDHGTTDDNTRN